MKLDSASTSKVSSSNSVSLILAIPAILSIIASLQPAREFAESVKIVLENWHKFETALWSAILEPIVNELKIQIDSDFYGGLTAIVSLIFISIGVNISPAENVKKITNSLTDKRSKFSVEYVWIFFLSCPVVILYLFDR